METIKPGLQNFEISPARVESTHTKRVDLISRYLPLFNPKTPLDIDFAPPVKPFSPDHSNLIKPFDLNNPYFLELISKYGIDVLPYIEGFLDSSTTESAFNKQVVFVRNNCPVIPKSEMLVSLGLSQIKPLLDDFEGLSALDQESCITAFEVAERLGDKGWLCILNGPYCGSISDFHIQIVNPDEFEGGQLQRRTFDTESFLSRDQAMAVMNKMWQNQVYATCKVLGFDQYIVSTLNSSNGFPISFKPKSEWVTSFEDLNQDQKIGLLLALIYNPGGLETILENPFSRKPIIESVEELIQGSNIESELKGTIIERLQNIDQYQRSLTPLKREFVESRILSN